MNEVMRDRYDAGESTATLAAEAGLSRVQVWRRIGRPARYLAGELPPPGPMFVAWAAGFFDGEGYVCVTSRGYVSARVSQTKTEPLEALRAAFGGQVVERPTFSTKHKRIWEWHVKGPRAASFLRLVRPYLLVKSEVTDVAMVALCRIGPRGRTIPDAEMAIRRGVYEAARDLNRRGRAEKST